MDETPPLTPRSGPTAAPSPARRTRLERRLRLIVAATISYNVVEAIVAITAGRVASSSALIGFGLDSTVEVLSAAAVAWQFAAADPHRRERAAMRIIALSFFGLAVVVGVDAVRTLAGAAEPRHSTVGIVLAALSLAIMPLLSRLERRTGREMGSASAVADSKQTLICSWLSAVLLVGLVLNSTLGWSWADPIAALVIAVVAVREGVEAWRGDACCTPLGAMLEHADGAEDGAEDGASDGAAGCADGCCAPAAASSSASSASSATSASPEASRTRD